MRHICRHAGRWQRIPKCRYFAVAYMHLPIFCIIFVAVKQQVASTPAREGTPLHIDFLSKLFYASHKSGAATPESRAQARFFAILPLRAAVASAGPVGQHRELYYLQTVGRFLKHLKTEMVKLHHFALGRNQTGLA